MPQFSHITSKIKEELTNKHFIISLIQKNLKARPHCQNNVFIMQHISIYNCVINEQYIYIYRIKIDKN